MTRVYIASNIPTSYPYKLQKPSTVNDKVRATAESFIFDSGIGNDELTNREVLDLAAEYDADYVVAKDYLHDRDRTTESVRDFIDIYPEHECDAIPLVPLQPPHAKHYRDLPGHQQYVLGGMAGEETSTDQAIRWIRDFRAVEPDAYVHGLGVGGGIEFVRRVAGTGLLDSIDCSTPELAATFGRVLDEHLRQRDVTVYSGEGSSKRTHPLAEFNSWQVADVWEREAAESGQMTLGQTTPQIAVTDGGAADAE